MTLEESVEFFKSKLLEAEGYIHFLEKEKYDLENNLETVTVKSHKQED
jgi:hypothetical protein